MDHQPERGPNESKRTGVHGHVMRQPWSSFTPCSYNAEDLRQAYSYVYGGYTVSQAGDGSPPPMPLGDVTGTPGLVQDSGSNQTTTVPILQTPSDGLSIMTSLPLHPHYADTSISPDMAMLNLGGQWDQPSHYQSVCSPRKELTEQQQPHTLFYTESDEGRRLDKIDSEFHTLQQLPDISGTISSLDASGSSILYPDVPGAGPSSTSPVVPFSDSGSAYAANVSHASQKDFPFVASPSLPPWGHNLPCDNLPSQYRISCPEQGECLSRPSHGLLSPPASMHPNGPERHRRWSSPRRLSTAPYAPGNVNYSPPFFRYLLSPSAIGSTRSMMLMLEDSPTQKHPPTVGQDIVKIEGASNAIRQAADRVRKKERKYKCKECGDTLTSKQNLNNHMNSHRGLNPYPCPHCSNEYRHRRSLNRHVKKKHPLLGQS